MALGQSNLVGNDRCLDMCIRRNYVGASAPGRSRRLHAVDCERPLLGDQITIGARYLVPNTFCDVHCSLCRASSRMLFPVATEPGQALSCTLPTREPESGG